LYVDFFSLLANILPSLSFFSFSYIFYFFLLAGAIEEYIKYKIGEIPFIVKIAQKKLNGGNKWPRPKGK
jgi:hypothetical protein